MMWILYLHLSTEHSVHCDNSGTYKRNAAQCHMESMAFKGASVTSVAMSGIVMTVIFLWVGSSHWFVDAMAMTHDLKLLLPRLGWRIHFYQEHGCLRELIQ